MSLFDKSVFVISNYDTQIKRLIAKGYTKEDALNRISSQTDVQVKAKYADYVIKNNSNIYDLENEVMMILEML